MSYPPIIDHMFHMDGIKVIKSFEYFFPDATVSGHVEEARVFVKVVHKNKAWSTYITPGMLNELGSLAYLVDVCKNELF